MKIELIEDSKGMEHVELTADDGKKTFYPLTRNEALMVGLIIGIQDGIEELIKKIK